MAYEIASEESGGSPEPEQVQYTPPPIMNERECATYLRMAPRTLRNHRRARRIPFVKVGGKIIYRRGEVDAALARLEVRSV